MGRNFGSCTNLRENARARMEEIKDREFDNRVKMIIKNILSGAEISERNREDFDTWKFNHSSDDVLDLLTEMVAETGRVKTLFECANCQKTQEKFECIASGHYSKRQRYFICDCGSQKFYVQRLPNLVFKNE